MSAYHKDIVKKFSKLYSTVEIEKIRKINNEIRLFFSYICINLIMQQIYLASKLFLDFDNESDLYHRSDDIIMVFQLTTAILMNYGISSSIKRAFNA